jgi:L-rhamnose mutarotase
MKRFAQTISLKPEREKDYIEHHSAVWPGVLKKLKECHISNYSIFVRGSVLFAYFEYTGEDYKADMARMAEDKETQRWWDTVKPLMEPLPDRKEGEFWSDMEEIFHID